jgi:hypothetical protein
MNPPCSGYPEKWPTVKQCRFFRHLCKSKKGAWYASVCCSIRRDGLRAAHWIQAIRDYGMKKLDERLEIRISNGLVKSAGMTRFLL